METLGVVRVFSHTDTDEVRRLATELYRLPSEDDPVLTDAHAPIHDRDRFRHRLFRWLAKGLVRPRPASPIDGRSVRKVLLFRYDALGDYVTTTSILEWLHAAIPGVIIDVVGSYRNRSLLASDPRIRKVVAINPAHGFRPSWLRVRNLGKAEDYDVIIAAVFTRMSKAAILTRLASRRALNVTIRHNDRAGVYGEVFDVQVPHMPAEHWALTMARIGPRSIVPVVGVPDGTARPKIPLDAASATRVVDWLRERGMRWSFRAETARVIPSAELPVLDSGRPYVIVNISAYSPNRRWTSTTCVPVIKGLRAARPDLRIVVSGAPAEADDVAAIVAAINDPDVVSWKGSITEMVAIICGAHALISPDTATIHVAAAAGVPCVVLFAELIKVAEWCPFDVAFRGVLSADPSTVNAIPPDVIVRAAMELV